MPRSSTITGHKAQAYGSLTSKFLPLQASAKLAQEVFTADCVKAVPVLPLCHTSSACQCPNKLVSCAGRHKLQLGELESRKDVASHPLCPLKAVVVIWRLAFGSNELTHLHGGTAGTGRIRRRAAVVSAKLV